MGPKTKAIAPDVPWQKIAGFRNIAVHAYFSINWDTVWVAATVNAPELLGLLRPAFDAENIEITS